MMIRNAALFLLMMITSSSCLAEPEETVNTPPHHMTLQEAVQLAPNARLLLQHCKVGNRTI